LSDCTAEERVYAETTRRLSEIYFARVRAYPGFETFEHLLRYDQFQYFNTMRYSQMLNRNLWLMNPIEHDLYLPHAMDMMSFATIDLMCSSAFPIEELGRLRESRGKPPQHLAAGDSPAGLHQRGLRAGGH
jgi:hypothetical protein